MRILFANTRPSPPFAYDGGSVQSVFTLVTHLASRGWDVEQLCTFPRDDPQLAYKNALKTCSTSDLTLDDRDSRGITRQAPLQGHDASADIQRITARGSISAIPSGRFEAMLRETLCRRKPDLLVTWLAGSQTALCLGLEMGIPTVLRVLDVNNRKGYPVVTAGTVILANSPIAAQYAGRFYGRYVGYLVEPVDHAAYVPPSRVGQYVTYVNPKNAKGVHLFRDIASRLPSVRFLVVCGWSWSDQDPDEKEALQSLRAAPTVDVVQPTSDMRSIYARTKLLLVPSRWPESWGRVVQEAQASGIPVLVSKRGCLPFNVGEGGIVIRYGSPDTWVAVIETLLRSPDVYDAFSRQATTNTLRFAVDPLIDEYESFFTQCARGKQPVALPPEPKAIYTYHAELHSSRLQLTKIRTSTMGPYDFSEPTFP